jgi:hypothetical protein
MSIQPPANICITLKAFDKVVNIGLAGSVSSAEQLPVHLADADARVEINLDAFTNLFAFYTDNIDVNNISSEDVRHYIDVNAIPTSIALGSSFDISPALVTARPITLTFPTGAALGAGDLIVKKDYVRHLSKLLFNTEYGVDLFVNESELSVSVGAALNAALLQCFVDMMDVSTTGNNDKLKGLSPNKYLNDDHSGSRDNGSRKNICAELLNVLLNSCVSRFTQLQRLEVADAKRVLIDPSVDKLYRLPFIDGDCIEIKVALKPANGDAQGVGAQDWFGEPTMLVNGASVNKADIQRSYKIDLVLKAPVVVPQ